MSSRRTHTALALLALGAATAGAQYSTPVGSGAAKPKTLCATAVLEWTGSLEKPNASRLMPIAIWDGEHYQPAGLYLARPAPLAFDTGTQYELERSGEPVGLFNVRGAAQLNGEWIGIGKYQPEAAPPPPPKLKVSKHLPVLATGKPDAAGKSAAAPDADTTSGNRPTLHRKTDDTSSAPATTQSSTSAPSGSTASTGSPASSKDTTQPSPGTDKPADPSGTASGDSSHPTLHRRTDSSDSTASTTSPAPDSSGTGSSGTTTSPAATGSSTGSSGDTDSDRPTLHRHADTPDPADTSGTAKSPGVDPDRPTLHKHDDAAASDPDRPTLHRARSGSDAAVSIDPDRPRLRYGASDDAGGAALPARLSGVPANMQQLVAVSDSTTSDPRPYRYRWSGPDDAAKMQSALEALAVQAIQKPAPATARPVAQFGPAARAAAHKPRQAHAPLRSVQLADQHFITYELSFSGGPTMVYTAHTADEGPQRIYVTLIAQPDFTGKPQVLLQQVARADRLDEIPAMQLVDALDTDHDQKAELIFQLNGAAQSPVVQAEPSQAASDLAASTATDNATLFAKAAAASAAASASQSAAAIPERAFAIYRVANGKAVQVFNTGPLP